MAAQIPVASPVSWFSVVPQLLLMWLLMVGYSQAGVDEFIVCGALTYVVISLLLRNTLAWHHRAGMRLVKKHRFLAAIPAFKKSYAFFEARPWLDKYRFLTLLSSSKMCYREMALCNIAFCHSQLGEGQQAMAYYHHTLELYPNNGLAQAALRMMQSVSPATN